MSSHSLLTLDEATRCIVRELDCVTTVLRGQHRPATIALLLHGKPSRAKLGETECRAVARFQRRRKSIERLGYGGLVNEQVDGYLSALTIDHYFVSALAA